MERVKGMQETRLVLAIQTSASLKDNKKYWE
jgi:hypothetical protein